MTDEQKRFFTAKALLVNPDWTHDDYRIQHFLDGCDSLIEYLDQREKINVDYEHGYEDRRKENEEYITSLEAQLSSKEQECERLKAELKTTEEALADKDRKLYNNDLASLRAENERLQIDASHHAYNCDMAKRERDKAENENISLRKRCEDLEAEREWILVNDRLPEERVMECLVFNGDAPEYNQNVASATWFNQSKTFRRHSGGHLGTITHWMPMVEAPKLLSQ